jgi:predicted PurR-regulated permease PerM
MTLLNTVIGIAVALIFVAVFGFVIFKLVTILNEQMNQWKKKMVKGNTKEEEIEKLKEQLKTLEEKK